MKHYIYIVSASNENLARVSFPLLVIEHLDEPFSAALRCKGSSIRFAGKGPVALSLCTAKVQLQPFARLWLPVGYLLGTGSAVPCLVGLTQIDMCSAVQDCQYQHQDATRGQSGGKCRMQARQGTSCEIDDVAQSAAVASQS